MSQNFLRQADDCDGLNWQEYHSDAVIRHWRAAAESVLCARLAAKNSVGNLIRMPSRRPPSSGSQHTRPDGAELSELCSPSNA